jgi:hypothetical protein
VIFSINSHIIFSFTNSHRKFKVTRNIIKDSQILQDLLLPFEEPVSRDNIDEYLNASLRRNCQLTYITLIPKTSIIYLPELCTATGDAMGSFNEVANQEMVTSDTVNNIISRMFHLTKKYITNSRFEWVRNNKNKKEVRPDITVYCKNVLLMVGEEKDVHSKLQTATGELDECLNFWNTLAFGDLPLVIGFVACGIQIQFYYYHVIGSSKKPTRVKIGDLLSLDGDNKLNNIQALLYTINIIRILRTFIHHDLVQTPYLKLFGVIYRKNGSVTIDADKVTKIIKKESIVDQIFHENFYQITFPELGIYENVEYETTKSTIRLKYGPVGYSIIPRSDDLRYAILNILEVVDKLHDEQVVHRDIRWDNVVKLSDNKWMLIDFEEAAKIGDVRYSSNIDSSMQLSLLTNFYYYCYKELH